MSNVSTVTPYAATSSGPGSTLAGAAIGLAGACVVGAVVGTIALARWLTEETPAERQALERSQEQRRRERLQSGPLKFGGAMGPEPLVSPEPAVPPIVSVALHLRRPETLVGTAEKLGYRLEPLVQLRTSLKQQQYLCLRGPNGERVAIEHRPEGGLLLHTLQQPQRLQALVHRHTMDQVVSHLQRSGMQVLTTTLTNGEVQILGRESKSQAQGRAAAIRAQISRDGTAQMDVDRVQGPRCAEIIQGLAQAMGGQITAMTKKDAYFQLPGEPTRVKQRV